MEKAAIGHREARFNDKHLSAAIARNNQPCRSAGLHHQRVDSSAYPPVYILSNRDASLYLEDSLAKDGGHCQPDL